MPLRFRILPRPADAPRVTPGGDAPALAEGPSEERTFELETDGAEVRIGRDPAAQIDLPFPAVSSRHARLFRGDSAQTWWVEDEGSANGTWLDGLRLVRGRPIPWRPGQRLRLATVDILFEGWSDTPQGADSTATLARRLIGDLFGAAGGDVPALSVEGALVPAATLRLVERERRYLIGRGDSCDLVLAGAEVSREHAAFIRRWDGVFANDLGSKNGLSVNGRAQNGELRLFDGDRVEVGPVTLCLSDPEDRYLRRVQRQGDDPGVAAAVAPSSFVDGAPPPPASAALASAAGSGPGARPRARRIATAVVGAIVLLAIAGLVALWASGG